MNLKSGKYWLDTDTQKLIEIDRQTTGSNGEPCPPMDCVPVVVFVAENESDVYDIMNAIEKERGTIAKEIEGDVSLLSDEARLKMTLEDTYENDQNYKVELKQSEGRRADGSLKGRWK